MKIDFPQNFLFRLQQLGPAVTELRSLEAECRLASEQLPDLAASEKQQREALSRLAPSVIVEFASATQAKFTALQKVQCQLGALKASQSFVEVRLAALESRLKREFNELSAELKGIIFRSFPAPVRGEAMIPTAFGLTSPTCAALLERVAKLNLADAAEWAQGMLELCAEFGAQLTEGAAK